MHPLSILDSPAAIIDLPRMQLNVQRMQQRMDDLGVDFRPHVKTSKCIQVVRSQIDAGAKGITVSTLKEAKCFFADGITNILYAVGMAPGKLPHVLSLRRQGCELKIITDSVSSAKAISDFGRTHGEAFEVWIEIDTDGHRSGIQPDEQTLLQVAHVLHDSGMVLGGVLTHAGSSYGLDTEKALVAMAEQERSGCVRSAEKIRDEGLPCPVVSVGSTPTALSARTLEGVTEVRAGVYVFFDLVMHNVGVCLMNDLALSVLTTVIGHRVEKGWVIVDAGWMAMSRDRGTQKQKRDFGYGQVCDIDGRILQGYLLSDVNQEHGIVSYQGAPDKNIEQRFPIGLQLRILPNHACATAAQFPEYHLLSNDGNLLSWDRFQGW